MTEKPDPKQYRIAVAALMCCRPVLYYPNLARAVGGVRPAILLCQLMYWQGTKVGQEFYKIVTELTAETGLTPEEQATARKTLIKLGVITAKRKGWPAIWHYQVHLERLEELLKGTQIPSSSESDDAGIRQRRNLATPESDDAGIRQRRNPTKPGNISRPSRNLTEGAINELNTESTSESTEEEEAAKNQNFLVLDDKLTQELLAFGVFKNKLREVDQSGWTAAQIRQLMADCRRDDKRGTPAALLLIRLKELEPKQPGFGYPQYSNLPEPPAPPADAGPSIHDAVFDAIHLALKPAVGGAQAEAIAGKVELVGVEGAAGPDAETEGTVGTNLFLACQPIIWDKYIKPNADAILTKLEPLGITAITFAEG